MVVGGGAVVRVDAEAPMGLFPLLRPLRERYWRLWRVGWHGCDCMWLVALQLTLGSAFGAAATTTAPLCLVAPVFRLLLLAVAPLTSLVGG